MGDFGGKPPETRVEQRLRLNVFTSYLYRDVRGQLQELEMLLVVKIMVRGRQSNWRRCETQAAIDPKHVLKPSQRAKALLTVKSSGSEQYAKKQDSKSE